MLLARRVAPSSIFALVQELGKDWNMPTFATEFSDCKAWKSAAKYNISHTYWHY